MCGFCGAQNSKCYVVQLSTGKGKMRYHCANAKHPTRFSMKNGQGYPNKLYRCDQSGCKGRGTGGPLPKHAEALDPTRKKLQTLLKKHSVQKRKRGKTTSKRPAKRRKSVKEEPPD